MVTAKTKPLHEALKRSGIGSLLEKYESSDLLPRENKDEMTTLSSPNITDVPEAEILCCLFGEHSLACLNLDYLGLGAGSPIRFLVRDPFVPAFGTRPGDIDALGLLDPGLGLAVAAEVKRLKVRAEDFLTVRVNKLPELEKGIEQVNNLFAFGFARTMLVVMTEVDSSDLTGVHEIFRVPFEVITAIKRILEALPLKEGIGLLSFIAVQNTKESFLWRGGWSRELLRSSIDRPQPEALSRTVIQYFGDNPRGR